MRILIVSPHYFPEQFKVTEIAEHLAYCNDVTVITNIPNYPDGYYFPGYGIFRRRKEVVNNVKIKRMFEIPRRKSKVFLLLNYVSFWISSMFYSVFSRTKYDIVLAYQISPITSMHSAVNISRKLKIPLITYVQDLWPESFRAVTRISAESIFYKMLGSYSTRLYKRSNAIFVSSKSFEEHLINKGVSPDRGYYYLPNHGEEIFENKLVCTDLGIEVDKVNVTFAGNIGKVQNLDILVDISLVLKSINRTDIVFRLIGDGSYKNDFMEKVKDQDVENYFSFHKRCNISDVPYFYNISDILFFSLIDDSFIQNTLPSKVQSYMAFDKPIFAVCGGESKRVINEYGFGFCVSNKLNSTAVTNKLIYLIDNLGVLQKKYDKNYYKSNFSKQSVFEKLDNYINDVTKERKNDV